MRRASLQAGLRSGRHFNEIRRPSANPSHNSFSMPKLHISRRIQHAITGLVLLIVSHIIPTYPVGFVLLSVATAAFYHVHRKRVHDESWDQWYLESFGELLREHEMGEWEDDKGADGDGGILSKKNSTKQRNRDTSSPKCKRRRKTIPALPGAFYFLIGTALSTLLFPTIVARTSLLILSIADPMAGIVGVWFSNMGWNVTWKQLIQRFQKSNAMVEGGPSLAGSIACGISTVFCTYVYIIPSTMINANSTMPAASLSLGSRIFIGAICAMTEAIAGRHVPLIGTMPDDNFLIPLVVGSFICWLDEVR